MPIAFEGVVETFGLYLVATYITHSSNFFRVYGCVSATYVRCTEVTVIF